MLSQLLAQQGARGHTEQRRSEIVVENHRILGVLGRVGSWRVSGLRLTLEFFQRIGLHLQWWILLKEQKPKVTK